MENYYTCNATFARHLTSFQNFLRRRRFLGQFIQVTVGMIHFEDRGSQCDGENGRMRGRARQRFSKLRYSVTFVGRIPFYLARCIQDVRRELLCKIDYPAWHINRPYLTRPPTIDLSRSSEKKAVSVMAIWRKRLFPINVKRKK